MNKAETEKIFRQVLKHLDSKIETRLNPDNRGRNILRETHESDFKYFMYLSYKNHDYWNLETLRYWIVLDDSGNSPYFSVSLACRKYKTFRSPKDAIKSTVLEKFAMSPPQGFSFHYTKKTKSEFIIEKRIQYTNRVSPDKISDILIELIRKTKNEVDKIIK